jgi:predicted  nucleic acid-binding Zn-ribbon protein
MRTKTKTADTSEKLICTVCGKEFSPNNDTKYIINGGYTCDWKCFLNEAKKRDAVKAEKNKKK